MLLRCHSLSDQTEPKMHYRRIKNEKSGLHRFFYAFSLLHRTAAGFSLHIPQKNKRSVPGRGSNQAGTVGLIEMLSL